MMVSLGAYIARCRCSRGSPPACRRLAFTRCVTQALSPLRAPGESASPPSFRPSPRRLPTRRTLHRSVPGRAPRPADYLPSGRAAHAFLLRRGRPAGPAADGAVRARVLIAVPTTNTKGQKTHRGSADSSASLSHCFFCVWLLGRQGGGCCSPTPWNADDALSRASSAGSGNAFQTSGLLSGSLPVLAARAR